MLLLHFNLTKPDDLGHRDRTIIMQSDVETVVITADMSAISKHLDSIKLKLGEARSAILTSQLSQNSLNIKSQSRALLSVITTATHSVESTELRYNELRHSHLNNNDNRMKRALEFLGDFLSTITGVPSAHDHRKVIEMLKAVKQQSSGIEKLLGASAQVNRQMIETLHLHDEKFEVYKRQLQAFNHAISMNQDAISKVSMTLSILAKVMLATTAFNRILNRAEQIVAKGDAGKLSRYSISETELAALIEKIYMRRVTSSPIFGKKECQFYYSLDLAHSWIDEEKETINTILQIPIARHSEKQKLHLLNNMNTLQNDLHLAVVNTGRNEYRYLSSTDYNKCIPSPKGTICQKREIRISPKLGCILKQDNCDYWADKVVHDLTNVEILISLPAESNATISCDKMPPKVIKLPKVALIHLDLNCNLLTTEFSVSKLSFRHVDEITVNGGEGIHIELDDDVTALTQGQMSHMLMEMTNASTNINYLNRTNNLLSEAIIAHTKEAEEKWEQVSGGWSSWEQIAVWTSIATEMILFVAVTICMCRMYCGILKRQSRVNGPSGVDATVTSLRDRLLDLEANVILNGPRVPAIEMIAANTTTANIENVD